MKKAYPYLNPVVNYFYPAKKTAGKKTLPNGKVKKPLKSGLKRLTKERLNILLFLTGIKTG
ncbi:MAG: hypothetical protein LBH43_00565 [Treponema sp.]|jgi:hypothetical protein|nr:hypothetical protein [Treponema sp.]